MSLGCFRPGIERRIYIFSQSYLFLTPHNHLQTSSDRFPALYHSQMTEIPRFFGPSKIQIIKFLLFALARVRFLGQLKDFMLS